MKRKETTISKQSKPKASIRKQIIKTRAKINKIEKRITIKKSHREYLRNIHIHTHTQKNQNLFEKINSAKVRDKINIQI